MSPFGTSPARSDARDDTVWGVTRHALTLAALVDAAVPGARPTRVEEVVERVGERFRVGFVEDDEGRRWAVRLPADAVAAALQDQSLSLLKLLTGRLPVEVPRPSGFATLRDGRRAMVYPLIPGRVLGFENLPPGPGPATALGETIAAVHNLDPALYDEAGVPSYSAEDCRRRRQSDVDLGAQTGLVPTGLLSRWEKMLDDVAWWRFSTRPVHGRLDAEHVLVGFADRDDAASARILALTSWEYAQVGDPAEDLASVLAGAGEQAADTVLAAYSSHLNEPADPALRQRATLLHELRLLSDLLTARRLDDRKALTLATETLRRLDDEVGDEEIVGNRSGTAIDTVPLDFTQEPTPADLYSAGRPARSAAFRANGDDDD